MTLDFPFTLSCHLLAIHNYAERGLTAQDETTLAKQLTELAILVDDASRCIDEEWRSRQPRKRMSIIDRGAGQQLLLSLGLAPKRMEITRRV